jgi:hypothetical protein
MKRQMANGAVFPFVKSESRSRFTNLHAVENLVPRCLDRPVSRALKFFTHLYLDARVPLPISASADRAECIMQMCC